MPERPPANAPSSQGAEALERLLDRVELAWRGGAVPATRAFLARRRPEVGMAPRAVQVQLSVRGRPVGAPPARPRGWRRLGGGGPATPRGPGRAAAGGRGGSLRTRRTAGQRRVRVGVAGAGHGAGAGGGAEAAPRRSAGRPRGGRALPARGPFRRPV